MAKKEMRYFNIQDLMVLGRSTALVGDGIFNGAYFPCEEIARAYKSMENKPLNLNHSSAIEDEVGYVKDVEYGDKKMSLVPVINNSLVKANVAKAYIENRLASGQVPELSVGVWTNSAIENIGGRDIEVCRDLAFDHLALVTRGACSPAAGCGVGLKNEAEDSPVMKNIKLDLNIDGKSLNGENMEKIEELSVKPTNEELVEEPAEEIVEEPIIEEATVEEVVEEMPVEEMATEVVAEVVEEPTVSVPAKVAEPIVSEATMFEDKLERCRALRVIVENENDDLKLQIEKLMMNYEELKADFEMLKLRKGIPKTLTAQEKSRIVAEEEYARLSEKMGRTERK